MLCVTYDLTRCWAGNRTAALWAVGLLSMTRIFFQPAMIARPDMLCGMFGLLAIWTTWRWCETRHIRWLTATGVLLGLGGLTHPFAIAYAMQIGVWILWEARGWRKLVATPYVAVVAMAVFLLWTPLILRHSDLFRVQIRNQFATSASEQLHWRLLNPWPSLAFQAEYMFDDMKLWQTLLAFVPLTFCTLYSFFCGIRGLRTACVLSWSSIYFLCATTGPHHEIWNYFAYPIALSAVCAGWLAASIGGWLVRHHLRPVAWMTGVALALSMVPGSHIRVLQVRLLNWNNPDYNAPLLAQQLLKDSPVNAVYVVDKEVLLDFFVAGRRVLAAQADPFYLSVHYLPYDYFLCGKYGRELGLVPKMCGVQVRVYGKLDDPLSPAIVVYKPSPEPCERTTVGKKSGH
jgi:4-amino-4-deoxy-L-arabinose transferase-like glycosyltransferase